MKIILDKDAEFQKKILELKVDDKEVYCIYTIGYEIKLKSVDELYSQLIDEMANDGKIGN